MSKSSFEKEGSIMGAADVVGAGDEAYTADEERRATRKVDLVLLSFVVLLFAAMQFDRVNVGAALTDALAKDIGASISQINLSTTLFTLAYVVFEMPGSLVGKRLGPHRWIPFIMLGWGLSTMCQFWLANPGGLYAARWFVATFEASFIPTSAFYLGRFYSRKQMGVRYALLWAGNNLAGALSGVFALGVLSLRGHLGHTGWQWLFMLEGIITIFFGIIAAFYLPADVSTPRSFFGRRWSLFTAREVEVITQRVDRDDPTKFERSMRRFSFTDIVRALGDWRIYGHCVAGFLSSVTISPINTYAPSLLKSLGFAGYSSNGLNAVGSVAAFFVSIGLAYNSDRTGERGIHIAFAMLVNAAGLLGTALPPRTASKWGLYSSLMIAEAGMGAGQGISAAWLSSYTDERLRPIALSAYVMSIQLANFVGANIVHAKDAPRYKPALFIASGCAFGGAAVILVWKFVLAKWGARPRTDETKVTEFPAAVAAEMATV